MNDVKRRVKSPNSRRILEDAQHEQEDLRERSLNESTAGHLW